jgi:tight adherence protein B
MDYLYYIFGILIFIAVVLALEGGYLAWNGSRGPEAARVSRRLRQMSARGADSQQASMIKQRLLSTSPFWQEVLEKVPLAGRIDQLLLQSGLNWSVGYMLAVSLACLAGGMCAGAVLFKAWSGALLAGLLLALVPLMMVRRARKQRLRQIEAQLPDALDMMGRALRAGHAFPTALKMVGDEMSLPISEEFKTVFDEVNFGMSMQDALTSMANRVTLTDMRFFVIAVVIQRETGGNLAELLASISAIMRDRIKLMAQVRVLTAEGRMSAWILSLLPFGAAGLIQLTNPTFMRLLFTDPIGMFLLGTAGALMVVGVFIMRSIIDIRV